jgi:hypothetical protein
MDHARYGSISEAERDMRTDIERVSEVVRDLVERIALLEQHVLLLQKTR